MLRFNKTLAYSVVALMIVGSLAISMQDQTREEHEGPGYWKQFIQMKQNENGEIPRGLWRQWERETPRMHGKETFFEEVKELGPTNIGGRIPGFIIDQEDSKHLIAGAATGGVWNSYDQGVSWEVANDFGSSLAVAAITQNPFNPDEIYYCTGARPKQSGSTQYSGDGLFYSTDRGKTFQYMDSSYIPAFDNSWDIVYSRTDSNTFYIGTLSHGLYRTQDKGMTFEQIHNTFGSDVYDIEVMPDGKVYFAVYSKGIYWFDEADTPVVQKFNINTGAFRRCEVEVSQSNPDIIYAAFASTLSTTINGVWKTTDGGDNWDKLPDPTLRNRNFDQNWFNFSLGVHPDDPNFVIIAGVYASFSTDGGNNWRLLRDGHVDYHKFTFLKGSNTFYALNDGGVYRYSKLTANSIVTDRNNLLNATQVYAGSYYPTGDNVLIGNQDNNTLKNINNSPQFSVQLGGDGAFTGIDLTGEYQYASSQFGNLRRWNGSRWVSIYSSLRSVLGSNDFWFINPFEINMADGEQIYFPTKNYIGRSTNYGTSWQRITNQIPGSVYAVGLTNEDNPDLYFGGQSGILYRIDDAKTATAGNSFKMFTLAPAQARGGFISCIKVDPTEPSTIYTAYSNISTQPRLWKIEAADTDEPKWTAITGNLPSNLPVNWVEVDPKNSDNLMIATDHGVYVSATGGRFWHKETTIPNVYTSMLRIRETDRKLFVFTFGRGVWIAQMKDEIIASTEEVVTTEVKVYPNPTVDYINLSKAANNAVHVYTLGGQKTELSAIGGKVDVSHLANGTYFVEYVNAEGVTSTGKFIKY